MALPCFSLLRYKFYDHRIKIIPDDIYDYLNYESLAHMIMCDGSFSSKGLTLNLQSFTLKELILLLNVLKIKFDLDCTIHKSRHQYVLYIRVKSVNKLYKVLTDYYNVNPLPLRGEGACPVGRYHTPHFLNKKVWG